MKRVHLHISGKVQGVFFRDSTCSQAEKRGVTGWVRNLRDGRVEAVLEGEPNAVDELVAWCQEGPPRARVEDVAVLKEEPTGAFDGFEKRRTV